MMDSVLPGAGEAGEATGACARPVRETTVEGTGNMRVGAVL
ncbi:hypothetical protein AB0F13_12920 [Streptomyces sp. NPDC026206]